MANYLNLEAISVPSGSTEGGLPIGIQLIVRRFEDRTMLQVARVIEAVTPQMAACE
jgi:aspartyl-tRNA(Asn)/glutamyl-tRNA(Gln) amidotransferase subunit A